MEVALRAPTMDHVSGIAYELCVAHDRTQRAVFQQRTPDGLAAIREGRSRATERPGR
ncbi:hypothetical protein [Nocardioides marmoriginsengisoli]|uniref:hypothetical protein n=1 Tax=Nocardioides marmoriginsengisoli TaxID=661483 RepID=UPI001FE88F16|nr:hypothetical protein [Nocardioides marmoriginsengisoli]